MEVYRSSILNCIPSNTLADNTTYCLIEVCGGWKLSLSLGGHLGNKECSSHITKVNFCLGLPIKSNYYCIVYVQ